MGRKDSGRAASAPHKWAVLATILVMTFMSSLDSSIVNVALPAMQRELAVDASGIQWVSSIYMLMCCSGSLVFGRLGDIYGKVRFYQFGVAVFTVGSLLCGLSTALPALVVSRAVQGVGSAAALATSMGIVTEAFPSNERGRALGIVTTFVSIGLMCGPTVGGLLVASYPWESVFLINVPIGVVGFAVGLKALPRDRSRMEGVRLDVPGAVLIVGAILSLFYALTGSSSGFTIASAAPLAVFAVLLAAFIAVERRAEQPLIRLEMFGQAGFTLNVLAMFLCFVAVGGIEYLMPFFLQDACGFPSDVAGAILTSMPLAMAVVGLFAGALSDRVGCAAPCAAGLVVYAAGTALLGELPADASVPLIVGSMAFMSAGTGLFQSPNNSLVMGSVGPEHLGFAGSVVALARYLGMSAGVTGGTALLYGRMSAVAGQPVHAYVEGQPELFLAGYSFTFWVFAALIGVGFAATVAAALLKRRARARS